MHVNKIMLFIQSDLVALGEPGLATTHIRDYASVLRVNIVLEEDI